MIIGSNHGENYNYSNGQEINHKTCSEDEKHDSKGFISK